MSGQAKSLKIMTAMILLFAAAASPLWADTGVRDYAVEFFDQRGVLVATGRLELEIGPEKANGGVAVSATHTTDRVDDHYQYLLGGVGEGGGSMRGAYLRLSLSQSILSPLLKIEGVMIPAHPGAFEGRWNRFGCFGGAAGSLIAWPIGSPASR